jgi:hypothetical protein
MRALLSIAAEVGLLAVHAATPEVWAPVQHAAELHPAWTEFKWPFVVDQWGIGRAFVCKPAECGVEVAVYLRPKIGFCKCATGVDGDDELERVGDNELIGADTVALGPGRPIEVAWMKGRSRAYRGADPMAAGQLLSIGFNDQCDVIVALATLGGGDPKALEPAVARLSQQRQGAALVKWLLL